jgi:hypothetical protein
MTKLPTPAQRLKILEQANQELARVAALVTPEVALEAAQKVRSARVSLAGALRRAQRLAAAIETQIDETGTMVWKQARVGLYWTSGPYVISTLWMSDAPGGGYALMRDRRELGRYQTWAAATEAARQDVVMREDA